jgi:hypothetical protein
LCIVCLNGDTTLFTLWSYNLDLKATLIKIEIVANGNVLALFHPPSLGLAFWVQKDTAQTKHHHQKHRQLAFKSFDWPINLYECLRPRVQ